MEKRIPRRRFKEFVGSGEWEEKKLGEVVDIYDGTHQTPNYTEEGIMFLSVENIKTLTSKKYISKQDFKKDFKVYPEKGDILMTRIGDVGTANVVKSSRPVAYYVSLALLKNNKLDSYFLKECIATKPVQMELWVRTLHIAFPKKINKNEIGNVSLPIPSLAEQEKIGHFFQKLDRLIDINKQKLGKLKASKSAYLTEMFPREGEDRPRRRFQGFIGAWEEKKLGEVGITFNGLSGKSKKDFGHGQAEFITYLNVFHNTISDIYGTDNVEIDDRQNQVKYGDIFFTTSSETPEEVGMSSVWIDNRPNVYLNSFCFGYRLLESINIYYIAYLLRSPSIRKEFQLLAQGISRYNISKTKAMDINIPIPSLAEQEKIGNFFQKLDQQIEVQEEKLEKLEKMKKAYLAEMFV